MPLIPRAGGAIQHEVIHTNLHQKIQSRYQLFVDFTRDFSLCR